MNNSHYPKLSLCKKLTEIGWNTETEKAIKTDWKVIKFLDSLDHTDLFCPSIMEMLDIIPEYINSDSHLTIGKHYCSYENTTIIQENSYIWSTFIVSHSHYIPDAIAEMIIWLYEHKYISFTK